MASRSNSCRASLSYIDGLGVVAKPIAEIHALNVHLAELLPGMAAYEQGEQGVLDVSMAPILPLDAGSGCNVAGAKCVGWANPEDQQD